MKEAAPELEGAPECAAGPCDECGHCACAHSDDPNVLPSCCECQCPEFVPLTGTGGQK